MIEAVLILIGLFLAFPIILASPQADANAIVLFGGMLIVAGVISLAVKTGVK